MEKIQAIFNISMSGIKFTLELDNHNKLPFLNVAIQRTPDRYSETSVHRKSTHTAQILNYHCNHPTIHKKFCIRTSFKRAKTTAVWRNCDDKMKTIHLKSSHRMDAPGASFRHQFGTYERLEQPKSKSQATKTNKFQPRGSLYLYIRQVSRMTSRILKPYSLIRATNQRELFDMPYPNRKQAVNLRRRAHFCIKYNAKNGSLNIRSKRKKVVNAIAQTPTSYQEI